MVNKVYEKISTFIKENIKQIIVLILLFLIVTVPIPSLYICTGGGITNIDKKIEINNQKDNNENLYMAYVSELKATIPFLLFALVNPNWDIQRYVNTNNKEEDVRGKIWLNNSLDNAIFLSYKKANKEIIINKYIHKILYVDEKINNQVLIGDEILLVDNKKIEGIDDYIDIVANKEVGQFVYLTLNRNNEKVETKLPVRMLDGKKVTGINFITNFEYETNPKINIKFENGETGPSGGLMIALSIYDNLVENKLSNGRKIVGTGMLDINGNVLEIGGVEYKFKAAVKEKADIFLVPNGDNYETVLKIKKDKNYNITIIPVDTFDEAIMKLK